MVKTLASKEKPATGYTPSKDRSTILNYWFGSDNHKLNLITIGKWKNSLAFQNITDWQRLSVYYKSQASACMNSNMFTSWFQVQFVQIIEQFFQFKILPSVPNLQDGDIKVLFFLPNVTYSCDNQRVLEYLKRKYRLKL